MIPLMKLLVIDNCTGLRLNGGSSRSPQLSAITLGVDLARAYVVGHKLTVNHLTR